MMAMSRLVAQAVSPETVAKVAQQNPRLEKRFHALLMGDSASAGSTPESSVSLMIRLARVARCVYRGREVEVFQEFYRTPGRDLDLAARLLAELAPGMEPHKRRTLLLEVVGRVPAGEGYPAVRQLIREPGWDESKCQALAAYFVRVPPGKFYAQVDLLKDASKEGQGALPFLVLLWKELHPDLPSPLLVTSDATVHARLISSILAAFNRALGEPWFTDVEIAVFQWGGKGSYEADRKRQPDAQALWPDIQRRVQRLIKQHSR